jgi:LCP family protein required for cell wall assembly
MFMKKLFLLPMCLFLFMASFALNVQAENIVPDGVEHVESFNVSVNVNADATVSVVEKVSYDFGAETKPGWTRYIPLNYKDLGSSKRSIDVSDVKVVDENNVAYVFNQSQIKSDDKKKSYLQIVIGDQNQQVSGMKTYILSYTVSGAIKFSTDSDQLFWNVTGDKWPVYVKYPEIIVTMPQRVDNDKIKKECFIGLHAATIDCIDRLEGKKDKEAHYSYKGVVSQQNMVTVVNFPKGITAKKTVASQSYIDRLKNDKKTQLVFCLLLIFHVAMLVFIKISYRKYPEFFSWKKWYKLLILVGKKFKLHHAATHAKNHAVKLKNKSRKWWIMFGILSSVLLVMGVVAFWKVDSILNKISVKGESVGTIMQASLPSQNQIKGEADDRINVLLLGILGADHPGGGLNTDTIMVASIKPKENKISMVSIPRDLWVVDPGRNTKSKINAVYEYGEEKGTGQGIEDMEKLLGEITGLQINYTAVVSTKGFSELVDTLGGVEVNLSKPFDETAQFADVKICDPDVYTIPTGEFENKKDKKGKIVVRNPLCKNKTPECGGDFHLPVGKNVLSGQQALCFVRSRYLTSDFERAKRQQLVLQQLKQQMSQIGLSAFVKINPILDNLGNNIQTDMQLWEMRRFFDLYNGMDNPKIYQQVLEDSKEGLLYAPSATPATGYILLPRGDNYDKIRNLFQNIFDTKEQSDIKPKI